MMRIKKFSLRVNPETLLFDSLQTDYWTNELHQHIVKHREETGSLHAKKILDNWETEKKKFVQICPKEVAPTLEHQLGFKEKTSQSELKHRTETHILSQLVEDSGFDTYGILDCDNTPNFQKSLDEFILKQHHGEMQWLQDRSHLRSNPRSLWPEVKTILVLGSNYHTNCNSLELLEKKDKGIVSVYSRNEDYHRVLKKKLKSLSLQISEKFQCDLKYFVDTAPVMEKPLGVQAGLGWQGKHTNLYHKFGSWLFLSSIFKY